MENQALWVDAPGQKSRIGPAPRPEPGEGELLIRVGVYLMRRGKSSQANDNI